MNDKSFIEKLKAEKSLDWKESAELDRLLDDHSLSKVALSSLPEEEPSLAWRSSLNQRLIGVQKTKKKLFATKWLGGLVTAACACFALTLLVAPRAEKEDKASIEAEIVRVHREASHHQDGFASTNAADEFNDLLPSDSTVDL